MGIKFDLLSVEAFDRIRVAMDLLIEYGYIERQENLRKTYYKYFHPEVLDYNNSEMWKKASNGEVISLFQFETPVGGDAIRRTKPKNIESLAIINSLMRLMASEGSEMPIDRYIHFQENIEYWYDEMHAHGLSEEEQEVLKSYLNQNYGVADSQELAMLLVMDKNISGFTLSEADALRKGIAKKKPEIIEEQKEKFYKKGTELGTSINMLNYVWNNELKPQFGYSFSLLWRHFLVTLNALSLNCGNLLRALVTKL